MLKKILKWCLGIFLVLALALAGALWYANDYLESNQEKLLQDYMSTKGMSVAMRNVRFRLWKDFPDVSMAVDSIVIRDTTRAVPLPDLFRARQISGRVNLNELLSGRIQVQNVDMTDAVFHLESDSTGQFNLGTLTEKDSTNTPDDSAGPSYFTLDWEGLVAQLTRVDITFIHPTKRKHIAVMANEVSAVFDHNDRDELRANTIVDLDFETLTFNTEKGGFLQNSSFKGPLDVTFGAEAYVLQPTQLLINDRLFDASATIKTEKTDSSEIHLATQDISFDEAVRLVTDALKEKMSDFNATGRFPVTADITTPLSSGANPKAIINFEFTGQDVKLRQYQFEEVFAKGSFVNRLTVAEGGIPGSRKNIRVVADDVKALYLNSILIEAPQIHMAVAGKDPILKSRMHFSGPASSVSDYLANDAFFFKRGRFTMDADVNASLLSFEDLVETTDGRISFFNTEVYYDPAGVNFPFNKISGSKNGEDIRFDITSTPLRSGFQFDLEGKLDNIVPLLVSQPAKRVNTTATLRTNRLDWGDFRALFGDDGRLVSDEESNLSGTNTGAAAGARLGKMEANTHPKPKKKNMARDSAAIAAAEDAAQVAAMKTALLGIENAFHPNFNLLIDTVAYYDVMTLTDFSTGLHFNDDTLVLERTKFNWADSEMQFAANLDMDEPGQTPFNVEFFAEHLNVNELRTSLDYFGLALPEGLETLPSDLHIDFKHAGKIADSIGVVPGYNRGRLVFDDGKTKLFSGTVDYAPTDGPGGLSTQLHLKGDPQVVNIMFAAENFFFGEGGFAIDLDINGVPATLPELIQSSAMHLRIDSSKVAYKPADVTIPIRTFDVKMEDGLTEYYVALVTDSTNRTVTMDGTMDELSLFLFPDTTLVLSAPFRMKANVRAKALGYNDLAEFIQMGDGISAESKTSQTASTNVNGEEWATPNTDTSTVDLLSFLSATGGVFNSFRPDMSLAIDTFYLTPNTPLLNLATGMRVRNENELVLEKTGFQLPDGGRVELDAVYALDSQKISPFQINLDIKDIDLHHLLNEVSTVTETNVNKFGDISGKVSVEGHMTGQLNEANRAVLYDSTQGEITYRMAELRMQDWKALRQIGDKIWMEDRFRNTALATLEGKLKIEQGVMTVPRTEVQSTPLHLFVEGNYSLKDGPDLLISVPVFPNIGRGVLDDPPAKTGYANAGWMIYLVQGTDEEGQPKTKFRLGRKKYYKERGRLAEFKELKAKLRAERKAGIRK